MQTSQNNIEKSLYHLAGLIDLELKRGWKTKLAEWFGEPISLLSNWINRNAIPKERIKYAEDRGYPREEWYIEEEIREKFTLGDGVTAEVTRGGVIVPEDPYQPTPEHVLPRNAGQPLNLVVDRDARDRSDIDKHHVSTLFEGENSEYLEMMQRILSSDDVVTKAALKANLRACDNHIKTKQEVEDLKREVRRLGKSIASSPNPGKDSTDEA